MDTEKPEVDGILITLGSAIVYDRIKELCASVMVGLDNPDVIALSGFFPEDFAMIVRHVDHYHESHEVTGPIVIITFSQQENLADTHTQIMQLVRMLQQNGYENLLLSEQ